MPGHAYGDDLKSRFSQSSSVTRPNLAFLASLLIKLLKVEVATSLGAIAGQPFFTKF